MTVGLQIFKLQYLIYFPVDFDQTYIQMFRLKSSILLDIFIIYIASPLKYASLSIATIPRTTLSNMISCNFVRLDSSDFKSRWLNMSVTELVFLYLFVMKLALYISTICICSFLCEQYSKFDLTMAKQASLSAHC